MPNVRYVHHTLHIIADIAQEFFEHILHDIGAEVADMRKTINGRAAGIHADLARLARHKLVHALCESVI